MIIMKELTVMELELVSGAGWLQDGLETLGGQFGTALWSTASDMLNVDLPLIGRVNLGIFAPDLGTEVGTSLGSTIGGFIETSLSALPKTGSFFTKLFRANVSTTA